MTGDVRPRIFALLYGDFPKLHNRLTTSLAKCVPLDVPVHLWLNIVCHDTKVLLAPGKTKPTWTVTDSPVNVGKYKLMRTMFQEALKDPSWNWAVWFDDDSHIDKPDWWAKCVEYVRAGRKEPNPVRYIGQSWYIHYSPKTWRVVEEASWYRKRPAELIKGKPGINFATGGYWWLSRDSLMELDWPDSRLNHNGGDHLLAQAVRQQGWPFHKWSYGVKVNDAKRRGYREPALGEK